MLPVGCPEVRNRLPKVARGISGCRCAWDVGFGTTTTATNSVPRPGEWKMRYAQIWG